MIVIQDAGDVGISLANTEDAVLCRIDPSLYRACCRIRLLLPRRRNLTHLRFTTPATASAPYVVDATVFQNFDALNSGFRNRIQIDKHDVDQAGVVGPWDRERLGVRLSG